jgi:hypothetical protein
MCVLFRAIRIGLGALVWLVGVVGFWWLIPVIPREQWEFAPPESYLGLLSDGVTLVSVSRQNPKAADPGDIVYLRNADSGQLRSAPLTFDRAQVAGLLCSENQDLVKVFHTNPPRLSLNDAATGRQVASFADLAGAKEDVDFRLLLKSCVLSRDSRTAAFASHKKPGYVEWYDLPSGRLLHRLFGYPGHVRFAPDARRLLVATGPKLFIFDVQTGLEVRQLDTSTWGLDSPVFLPDGKRILDEYCNVWEIATNTRLFNVPLNWVSEIAFTPDGRELVAWDESSLAPQSDNWLAYFDAVTGQEHVDRRVRLEFDRRMMPGPSLIPCGKWLLARGEGHVQRFRALTDWITRHTGLKIPTDDRTADTYILVEAQTGRVAARGEGIAEACTQDGRHVLIKNAKGIEQVWKVPSPNAIPMFALTTITWCFAPVLATWYYRASKRGKRRRC